VTKKDSGKLCRECHKWKLWKHLDAGYDKRGEAFVIVWYCRDCGNQVGEVWLGQRGGDEDGRGSEVDTGDVRARSEGV
jgi:hypothetical protein